MLFLQNKNLWSPKIPLYKLIPVDTHSYNTRISEINTTDHCRIDTFKHSFFLWTIVEWNKLDLQCRKCTYNVFRKHLCKSIWLLSNPIYNIYDPLGICLLTRLRLGLSHLNKHRFNHNFNNCINPLCTCTLEIESTAHFFLHYHFYSNIHKTLSDDLNGININISNFSETALIYFYMENQVLIRSRLEILTVSIKYAVDSERFTGSIFYYRKSFY